MVQITNWRNPIDKVFYEFQVRAGIDNAFKVLCQTIQELPATCTFEMFANKSVDVCNRILPDQVDTLKGAWHALAGITVSIKRAPSRSCSVKSDAGSYAFIDHSAPS